MLREKSQPCDEDWHGTLNGKGSEAAHGGSGVPQATGARMVCGPLFRQKEFAKLESL